MLLFAAHRRATLLAESAARAAASQLDRQLVHHDPTAPPQLDVVAAETGGALLDTLFIDEGFGTLDAETLDIVMNILDELRAGGRVVGLVSHVEELRQRIPTRLRVRKSRSGSTLEVQAG